MRQFLAALSTAILASSSFAADAAADINTLVQKLGSPRFADREEAGQALLKIGITALPAVKTAAETNADPEIRERAAALVDPLSKTSDSAKLLAVKAVKIEYKAMPLTAMIADLKSKTGIPLTLVMEKISDRNRVVTVPAGEYAPWEALEVVFKAAGLKEDHRAEFPPPTTPAQPNGYRNGRWNRFGDYDETPQNNYTPSTAPVLLVDGVTESLPMTNSGGVRVLALPANFAQNRVIRGAGRVVFHLDVAPLPSLGWSGASGIRITLAEDEDGRPLFSDLKLQTDPFFNAYDPWNNFGGRWGGRRVFWGGGGMIQSYYGGGNSTGNENPRLLPVALRTNDRSTTMLRKLEGVVLGDVHTANVPVITIDDVTKSLNTTVNGPQQSSIVITELKKQTNGSHTLKLKYESLTQWALMQAGGGAGNFIGNPDNPSEILGRMKFYDADGKAIATPNQDTTSVSGDGMRQTMDVTLRFNGKDSKIPVKMVVTGTKVTSVEVPFKLINVRVP